MMWLWTYLAGIPIMSVAFTYYRWTTLYVEQWLKVEDVCLSILVSFFWPITLPLYILHYIGEEFSEHKDKGLIKKKSKEEKFKDHMDNMLK